MVIFEEGQTLRVADNESNRFAVKEHIGTIVTVIKVRLGSRGITVRLNNGKQAWWFKTRFEEPGGPW